MEDLPTLPASQTVQLQELSPRHKQVVSLLVQGVKRELIAQICEYTPEYITWLGRQPLCVAYFKELSEFADQRLVALSDKTVDVLIDAMDNGGHENALKAAKLQMEATGRIGRFKENAPSSPSEERLKILGDRLTALLKSHQEKVIEGEVVHEQG